VTLPADLTLEVPEGATWQVSATLVFNAFSGDPNDNFSCPDQNANRLDLDVRYTAGPDLLSSCLSANTQGAVGGFVFGATLFGSSPEVIAQFTACDY
jgi:hypothetical protein